MTLSWYIRSAYIGYDHGRFDPLASLPPITGGPKWIESDTYRIGARAEGLAESDLYTRALMMRSLVHTRIARVLDGIRRFARGIRVAKPGGELPRESRGQPQYECHCHLDFAEAYRRKFSDAS
jgi:hypothetical protein